MKINIRQAVKTFFSNPSLEMVFIEAVANSIDAEATKIDISISINEFSKPESLKIDIKDNGVGFTDERFDKFSKLLQVEEDSHKGIGRLVFLSHFEKVDITSKYANKQRTFQYSNEFNETSEVVESSADVKETILSFSKYYPSRIANQNYIKPTSLRKKILENFYPRLYLMKQEGKSLIITISLNIGESKTELISDKQILNISDIGTLIVEPVDALLLDMFEEMNIHYSIKQEGYDKTVITALCVDERTYKVDIISDENIPAGYELIFILYSKLFDGKVNPARQELTLEKSMLKTVKKIFQKKVAEILEVKVPIIVKNNAKTKEDLTNTYPHLLGYFEEDTIGFIKRDDTIRNAQDKFFTAQKEVLEADNISDEIFQKSLNLSSRALAEYILYRDVTIKKLKAINNTNSEEEIHNLIVPQRKKATKSGFISDLYTNNVWVLDDKYMTFNTVLSEHTISDLIQIITKDEKKETDTARPDIAIVFSNNPETSDKVDVVIVELKKKNVPLEENKKALVQLEQRARKLLKHYPKIQRMWFYAVVEFNDELKMSLLTDEYTPLFSSDSMYYKEVKIVIDLKTGEKLPVGMYMLSLDALIEDAHSRNSTFLNILKDGFKNKDVPKDAEKKTIAEHAESLENKLRTG